jgi:hypothetical protein
MDMKDVIGPQMSRHMCLADIVVFILLEEWQAIARVKTLATFPDCTIPHHTMGAWLCVTHDNKLTSDDILYGMSLEFWKYVTVCCWTMSVSFNN